MGERPVSTDAPASEALATTGLFLNIASVIALAVSLASWGASNAAIAAVAGATALLAFIGSLICFGMQAEDRETQQVA
jgi:hypothetical protein